MNTLHSLKALVLSAMLVCLATTGLKAQTVINLAGEWQFQMDPADRGIEEEWYKDSYQLKDNISLPASMPQRLKGNDISVDTKWVGSLYDSSYFFNPYMAQYRRPGKDMKLQFFLTPDKHYVGPAWYKKEVVLSDDQTLPMYTLFLERPHITTDVWVNGVKTKWGETSLSVPHKYFLYGYLQPGKNTITIRVNNDPETVKVGQDSHSVSDQTQGDWNGIVGKIELRKASHIDHVYVYPDIDKRTAKVHLELSDWVRLKNSATVTIKATAFNTDKEHVVTLPSRTVEIGTDNATSCDLTLDMRYDDGKPMTGSYNYKTDLLLWDEFNPQLYLLEVDVVSATGECSHEETVFGMRKVEIRDKMFYINGHPIQLRGTVENCDFPLTGYPPMDLESWLKVFRTCKSYGLNHMRFHSYCPPEAAFLAADMMGFYIQPEGPSWPNHGVKLGVGQPIDVYLMDEAINITNEYGNHPSFTMFCFGNEPAGNWVKWATEHTKMLRETFPEYNRFYGGFSVGGGWAWQPGSEYQVKAGARGLGEWARRAPESTVDFRNNIAMYNGKDAPGTPIEMPYISHETGQWCAFPNFDEINKYTGVNKAKNFEIFRDLLRDNGMESRAQDFMMASGRLQALCYKAEVERTLRTPNYAGFQILSLNDYSGQGTALVGVTDVFFDNKGYITEEEFSEFCSPIVPLARIPKFTYKSSETFEATVELNQFCDSTILNGKLHWTIYEGPVKHGVNKHAGKIVYAEGDFDARNLPIGSNLELGKVFLSLKKVTAPAKLTLSVSMPETDVFNHWDFWVYPDQDATKEMANKATQKKNMQAESFFALGANYNDIYVTDSLDEQAKKVLNKGGKVLICAAGKVSYGKEVVQQFTPVFWNTSWFKMRPPHTTGIFVENTHSIFDLFPTDYFSDYQWWELVNRAQVMQFTDFPRSFQPLVQSIDTWFISRKIGMLFEANVGKGRLVMTSMDLTSDLANRVAARQMRASILSYMMSDKFTPQWTLDQQLISDLFTKVAGDINLHTNDSPDELKPKLK